MVCDKIKTTCFENKLQHDVFSIEKQLTCVTILGCYLLKSKIEFIAILLLTMNESRHDKKLTKIASTYI